LDQELKRIEKEAARHAASPRTTTPPRSFELPFPVIVALAAVFPLVRLAQWRRRRRRIAAQLCATCGYDVRSNDAKCSECGSDIGRAQPRTEA
jgi:hypothetical protein